MTSTSARTMAYLRTQGYTVGDTQKPWNPYTKKRTDLFGIFDCLAFNDEVTLGVQACGSTDFAEHRRKMLASSVLKPWCMSNRKAVLIGWSKRVARGKNGKKMKVKRWTPRIEYLDPTEK